MKMGGRDRIWEKCPFDNFSSALQHPYVSVSEFPAYSAYYLKLTTTTFAVLTKLCKVFYG